MISLKVPPHNMEAEQAILGGILVDPRNIKRVSALIGPADFYREAHGHIFKAMQELNQIDLVTLRDQLQKDGKLEKAGGEDYISSLVMAVSTSIGWQGHAEIVKKHSVSRQILAQCGVAINGLQSQYLDPAVAISDLKNSLRSITINEKDDYSNLSLYGKLYDDIGNKDPNFEPGYRTGIGNLDDFFYFEPGYIHCFCAESNIGKTPVMLQIADNIAKRYGRTHYYSLESTRAKLGQRNLARRTHIHLSRIHSKNIHDGEFEKLFKATDELMNSNLILIDNSKYNYIEDLVNHIETEALNSEIKCIVIDFLQYQYSRTKQQSRHHEISYILSKYKGLAKDLNIPVIYASQLDKAMQKRADNERKPRVGDLKESGDIQTMTDNILALYAPDKLKNTGKMPVYQCEIYTLKSKDQEPFSTWLNFNGHFQEFTDGERPENGSYNGRTF
jgi:replicative DNA helicase